MAEYDIFLYFSGDPDEKAVWDSEFSYYLGLLLNRIMDSHPKMVSNANVPGCIHRSGNSPAGLEKLKAFVFISGKEDIQQIYALRQFIDRMDEHQKERIMVVCRPQKQITALPECLTGRPVYEFFELNRHTQQVNEFYPKEKETKSLYWEKLTDVAYHLKQKLLGNELPEIPGTRSNTIYLAEVSPDQNKNRERLKRELILSGYHVLPSKPLPSFLKEFENAVSEYLEESILSVNILGESYGNSPGNTDYSYPELQNRLFNDVSKKLLVFDDVQPKISRIVWIPPVFEPVEEKQTQYLKRIKKEISASVHSEFIQSNIYDLKNIIDQKLALPVNTAKKTTSPFDLLLIADDYRDIACVVIKEEAGNSALNMISMKSLTGVQNTENMLNEVKKYKNVLILNTKNDANWLYSVLSILAKSKGYADAVIPSIVGLFSPNQIKEVPELTMLDIEPYIYNSQNINKLLQSFIIKTRI